MGNALVDNGHGAALKKSGTAFLRGAPGTILARYETVAMVRVPAFHTAPVSQLEARQVLRQGRAGVISFLLEPYGEHPPNAWLYVCRDRSYVRDKLSNEARREARRVQGSLRIEPIDWMTLLENGLVAYSDA